MPFKTAWLFSNPHFQTIWPALFRRTQKPAYIRHRLELSDGDFIDIDWCGVERSEAPVAILLHGLEGSSDSPYIRGLASLLGHLGWRCAAINFRGCSGESNRLQRSYHSGATDDLGEIVTFLSGYCPNSKLHAVGFSLGGNVLLKWCAETGRQNPLNAAIAISVPYKLSVAGKTLDGKGFFRRLYRWRLLSSLKKKLIQKIKVGTIDHNIADIKYIRSFYEFDDLFTAPLHGYKNADDYYTRASSHPHLDKIQIPTLLLHAADDPFMNSSVITEQTERSPSVKLELSKHGGHVGFYQPSWGANSYWLETRITDYLKKAVEER